MKNKKINLLYFVKSLEMGGMEKSTILYSNNLSKRINYVGIYASEGFYDDSGIIESSVKRW